MSLKKILAVGVIVPCVVVLSGCDGAPSTKKGAEQFETPDGESVTCIVFNNNGGSSVALSCDWGSTK